MNKKKGIISLILTVVLIGLLGFTTIVGFGDAHIGASKNIKLGLDLHFEQNGIHYNCDFKSGFSSNEKGNTNRLLLVASIYNSLGEIEKNILFVRQTEDENNHYLKTLKNSLYWEVYCADDGYAAMKEFTGFDMRKWLNENADWENDISTELKQHLECNDLLKYLTW